MKVLSLFSGVGGFDMGLEAAGMETVFQCEWDKHANQILNRHWPHVPKWDDVSTLTGKHILQHAPAVDVVAWGSPCQDLSVAGKRAGLEGERSGLFHEGIRIIKELRKETNNEYPRISIWENVAGALSSNRGADFGVILNEMAEAGALVIEWAMLDAQHFGIPQRRRRVFLIAIFDPAIATNCPSPLLPVSPSLRGDTTKGKPKRKSAASETATGFGTGSQREQQPIEISFAESSFAQFKEGDVAALKASGGVLGGGSETLIVGALTVSDLTRQVTNEIVHKNLLQVVEPFVKSRRAQSSTDDETWVEGEVNPTLNSFDVGDTRATTAIIEVDPVGSLQARDYKGVNHEGARDGKLIVEQPVLFENSYRDGARIAKDGVTQTLSAKMGTGGGNTPMLAFDTQFGSNANVFEDQSPTLKASQQSPSVAYDEYNDSLSDVHHALRAGTKQSTGVLEPTMAVRRLTPQECELLMGWPLDHTRWKADGTEQADTHRYKQCGNGVASPVAEWIGKHLMKLDN